VEISIGGIISQERPLLQTTRDVYVESSYLIDKMSTLSRFAISLAGASSEQRARPSIE
jgi:hypothetical protein